MIETVSKISAIKNFSNIVNQVSCESNQVIITHQGKELAAIIPINDLKLLQKIEDYIDIEDAWKAKLESNERISWDNLREELDV